MQKGPATSPESITVKTQTFTGAFLMFLPIVPIIATIVCIATYLGMNLKAPAMLFDIRWLDTLFPLLVGTISTFFLWIILSFLLRPFTAVDRVNEQSYYSLMDHLSTLKYYTEKFPNDTKEVSEYLDSFDQALNQRSFTWVLEKGYLKLWDLMNSAEEALITAAPLNKVIADAVYDEMRLDNSNITNSEERSNKLRVAINELDPNSIRYLKPSLGIQTLKSANDQSSLTADQGGNSASPSQTSASGQGENANSAPLTLASGDEENTNSTSQSQVLGQKENVEERQKLVARSILRAVRETINDFNANSWAALINARNQLYSTMTLVGLTMFVFVAIAILLHINLVHLEAATPRHV
jgi:hypothetical protein